MTEPQPRPRAVTLACVFVGVTAGFLFFSVTGLLDEWGSVEMQDALKPAVTSLNDSGYAVTLSGLLAGLRWVAFAYVGITVAGVVLSVYAMRRDRSARVGLSVVAVLLALVMPALGLLGAIQAGVLFACAVTFWASDARAWFATPSEAAEDSAEAPPELAPRPQPVRTAGVITVIGSAFAGGASALYVLVYALAGDALVTAGRDGIMASWLSADEIDDAFRSSFWICLAMLPLAAAGVAAGVALLAGMRFGRVATLVVSWLTVPAGFVALPLGLIGSIAAVFVITLLNRAESRAWFQH